MADIIKMVIIILANIMMFVMLGTIVNKLFNTKRTGGITIITGFFSWYAIQEIIYIPIVFTNADMKIYVIEQVVMYLIITVMYICFYRKKLFKLVSHILRDIKNAGYKPVIFCVVMNVLIVILLIGSKTYSDEYMHTISTAEAAVATGKIYMYDSETGEALTKPYITEAISMWNIEAAVWCRIFKIGTQKMVKYCMGLICLFVTLLVNLRLGRRMFKGSPSYAYYFAGCCAAGMLLFATGDTAAAQIVFSGGIPGACFSCIIAPFILYWALRRSKTKDYYDFKIMSLIIITALGASLHAFMASLVMFVIIIIVERLTHVFEKCKTGLVSGDTAVH